MTDLVLVGVLNPYGANPRHALFCFPRGSSGERMQRLVLGMRRHEYIALERHNLCVGKWSAPAARTRAAAIPRGEGRVLCLLGAQVAKAFGCTFEAYTQPADDIIILPHPSGLNRMWSEAGAYQRARDLVASVCPDLELGVLR